MSRHLQTLFLLAVLSFLFVIPTQAQVTTASMSGTVMFQDEPVIGATVLAVHEPSGTNYGTITNVDGRFSLQGMRTGGRIRMKPLAIMGRMRHRSIISLWMKPIKWQIK